MLLFILITLIGVGAILSKIGWLKQFHITWLNRWIFFVALPAVALANIPQMKIDSEFFIPFGCAVLVFLGSLFFFKMILKTKLTANEKTSLSILGGLGNTSFIGFPVITFLYGADRLSHAVIFDQGTFILLATGAQFLIAKNSGGVSNKAILKRILTFPPFVALVVSIFIPSGFFKIEIQETLKWFASTVSPVAMIVVGFQVVRFASFHFTKPMFLGLLYKLFLAPVLIFSALFMLPVSKELIQTSVIEASMAPMISAGILLVDREIESKLSAQFLFWGIVLSFFSSLLFWHPISNSIF